MKEEDLKQEEWDDVNELRQDETEAEEAVEAIKKFTNEEDDNDMGELSLRSVLGGDVLGSKFFLKQVVFVMFCVVLMLLYTGNRYASQQDAILIDSLRQDLQNVKYNVMTQSSELMNLTRQSNVEKMLRTTKDSVLQNPVTPPFLIRRDGEVEPIIKEENDPNLPTGDEV
ncbi:MAG: hypothetical protein IJ901_00615 [Bacteroidaceae bacterium]|jgi:hypothetical protein|nr:hypothetical protein [Bacteroidaceae bacterium]